MKTMQKTLLTIVAALTFAGCVEQKPELKNYTPYTGTIWRGTGNAYISGDSTGKAYKINNKDGDIAIDTNIMNAPWEKADKNVIVMNPEMVEIATNLLRNQSKLSYLLDSASYAQRHK